MRYRRLATARDIIAKCDKLLAVDGRLSRATGFPVHETYVGRFHISHLTPFCGIRRTANAPWMPQPLAAEKALSHHAGDEYLLEQYDIYRRGLGKVFSAEPRPLILIGFRRPSEWVEEFLASEHPAICSHG